MKSPETSLAAMFAWRAEREGDGLASICYIPIPIRVPDLAIPTVHAFPSACCLLYLLKLARSPECSHEEDPV